MRLSSYVVPSALAAAAALFSGPASATPIWYARAVGAFSTYDSYGDIVMHAIVPTSDGNIRDVSFQPFVFESSTVLGTFPNIVGVAGYSSFAEGFQTRHVVVALANGQIWHLYYGPDQAVSQSYIGKVLGSIVSVTAWANTDGTQNCIVATSGPFQPLLWYFSHYGNGSAPQDGELLPGQPGQMDISGWVDSFGENELAIMTFTNGPTSNGTSTVWKATWEEGESVLDARITVDQGPAIVPTVLGSLSGFRLAPASFPTDDILFLDEPAPYSELGIMEDLGYGNVLTGPAVTAPGFTFPYSIAGTMEINSVRRHALVALISGEIRDYFSEGADGAGPWTQVTLGTF
jgi:hypothetical protein